MATSHWVARNHRVRMRNRASAGKGELRVPVGAGSLENQGRVIKREEDASAVKDRALDSENLCVMLLRSARNALEKPRGTEISCGI